MSTWIKLDVDCFMHPKVVRLDDDVRWLWVAGLCYAGMHLTDGDLPSDVLGLLAKSKNPDRAAGELVAAGLWALTDDGYRIVGYTEHQESREKVEAKRQAARERQQRKRERESSDVTDASRRDISVTHGEVTPIDEDVDEDEDPPLPPAVHPPAANQDIGEGEDSISEALDAYADRVTANAGPRNPGAYRAKVRANVSDLQWDRAATLLAGWELTPVEVGQVLASEYVDEPSPTLLAARRKETA